MQGIHFPHLGRYLRLGSYCASGQEHKQRMNNNGSSKEEEGRTCAHPPSSDALLRFTCFGAFLLSTPALSAPPLPSCAGQPEQLPMTESLPKWEGDRQEECLCCHVEVNSGIGLAPSRRQLCQTARAYSASKPRVEAHNMVTFSSARSHEPCRQRAGVIACLGTDTAKGRGRDLRKQSKYM